jgi:hypothetical protein
MTFVMSVRSKKFLATLTALFSVATMLLGARIASADEVWFQSYQRASAFDACVSQPGETPWQDSWGPNPDWAPSWEQWANNGQGGWVCSRSITWARDSAVRTYALGDIGPGGGTVFYDAGSQQPWGRYLEVAPSNWSGGSGDPALVWGVNVGTELAPAGCAISDIVGTGYGIGDGESNTDLITSNPDCDDASKAPAAWAAKNYTGGSGTSDWYLPSWLELTQLCRYANRATFDASAEVCPSSGALVDGFSNGGYCSSSQVGTPYIYLHNFNDGNRYTLPKSDTYFVRPIRAF